MAVHLESRAYKAGQHGLGRRAWLRMSLLALLLGLLAPGALSAQETAQAEAPASAPSQAALAPATEAEDQTYRLGPGDKIRIDVFSQDDLTGTYELNGTGRFSMHLIGQVNAAGLTATELESLLIDRLQPDYLVNPRISVQVLNYRPYYIIGEVARSGAFAYVDGMTYLNAVALAGGFTYRAKKDVVFVVRADDKDKQELKLDVNERVMPGDVIRIGERLF